MGKACAAVIALQLAEEDALDLDAPVREALPWFSVRGGHPAISLHHLLTHTSGLIESPTARPRQSAAGHTATWSRSRPGLHPVNLDG